MGKSTQKLGLYGPKRGKNGGSSKKW